MKTLLWLMLLVCGAASLAHGELVSAEPADASTLSSQPTAVTLTFSEAVEPSFSSFMVRPLRESDENAVTTRREAFIAEVLTDVSGKFNVRPDSPGASETITLPLSDDLPPGTYAVVWRALSTDTHTMQNLVTFTYQP